MERTTNRGRPKGSRGGRGKGKRGRKPRVVVSDTESQEVDTNQAQETEEATNVVSEVENPMETDVPKAVEVGPMEVKEVRSPKQHEIVVF